MNEDMINRIKQINSIYESSYSNIEPQVLYIINNNVKDVKTIEKYLDLLLDIPTDEGVKLYKILCNYYKNINKENSEFYVREYKKLLKKD